MSEVVAETPKRRTRTAETPEKSPREIGKVLDFALLLAFLALTFLLGVFPLKDTDFWWHLRTGDLIRQTGKVPTVDTYTFGAAGYPWIDLHWIFQVLISYGYQTIGISGIHLVKCVINCLAIGLLVTAKKKEWPLWLMLLVWIPGLLVVSGRMYIRPETLTLFYMSCFLAVLFRIDRYPQLAFLLPIVQLFWVNTQGLFVLGPGLLVFALLASLRLPNALTPAAIPWWRTMLIATALTGVACFVNPYGFKGAIYPLQLMNTMSNPIFRNSIGELKPVNQFIAENGFTHPVLLIQLSTLGLGIFSFFLLIMSRVVDRRNGNPAPAPSDTKKKKTSSASKKAIQAANDAANFAQAALLFRLIAFVAFSYLSWQASRNSHQFGAIAGAITAWNFGEWGAEVFNRRREQGKTLRANTGRLVSFASIIGVIVFVASGAFYNFCGEGRTVGLGEEPHWFPHEAVAFAGGADMPTRSICFHNGHAALYEYAHAPDRKTFADARLEVIGPKLYTEYVELEKKISQNAPGWERQLDNMQRPLVLVDNVHSYQAGTNATLLTAKDYQCVWFDEIAAMFVHKSYAGAAQARGINFAEAHFNGRDGLSTDYTAEAMLAKTSWNIMFSLLPKPDSVNRSGWRDVSHAMIWKGLDHCRELRRLDPAGFEGWKWAGMLELSREPAGSGEPIPRFRMEFDPVFDLSNIRASYLLAEALKRKPDDANALNSLGGIELQRGMFEAALARFDRFVANAPTNTPQEQIRKKVADDQRVKMIMELGTPPESLKWSNLSDLDQLISTLYRQGRAATAANVLESAYPADNRPWVVADRIATIHLHLGEPARAQKLWAEAKNPPTEALRHARMALALFAQTDHESARKEYQEAIRLDPKLFEAYFGLIILESDLRHGRETLDLISAAEKCVPHSAAGAMLDRLRLTIEPYVAPKK